MTVPLSIPHPDLSVWPDCWPSVKADVYDWGVVLPSQNPPPTPTNTLCRQLEQGRREGERQGAASDGRSLGGCAEAPTEGLLSLGAGWLSCVFYRDVITAVGSGGEERCWDGECRVTGHGASGGQGWRTSACTITKVRLPSLAPSHGPGLPPSSSQSDVHFLGRPL